MIYVCSVIVIMSGLIFYSQTTSEEGISDAVVTAILLLIFAASCVALILAYVDVWGWIFRVHYF